MKKQLFYLLLFGIVAILVIYTKNTPVIPVASPTKSTPTDPQVLAAAAGIPTNCHARQTNPNDPESFEPDHICTPGVINPAVMQDNIATTICQSGYTKTIRPPVSYTEPLKIESMKDYAYTDNNTRDYEEDHLISLELGGSPTDPKNLWPEPGASPNEKDRVENYLRKQVCNGSMPLEKAQQKISTDWYTVYLQINK